MIHVRATRDFRFLVDRTGCPVTKDFRAIEAIDERGGRTLGMVGYDGWTPNSVQMHVAIDSAIAVRRLLQPAFSYVFEQVGLGVAYGSTPAWNKRALAFNESVGWKVVHRLKDGWSPGVDIVLQEMRKETCRWLRRRGV